MTEQSPVQVAQNHGQGNGPYARKGDQYWRKSWTNPIPVEGKSRPIKGFTGFDGANATWADIQRWTQTQADKNIGLRALCWIGIDVDDYDGKTGGATLAAAVSALGELPPTWSSTSRGPGQGARIYFFQIPVGLEVAKAEKRFTDRFGSDVEIIHRTHRYAIVAPSIHPETGQEYRWYTPEGEPSEDIPSRTQDLPMLPQAWQDFLATPEPATAAAGEDDPWDLASEDRPWTRDGAERMIAEKLAAIRAMDRHSRVNETIGGAARFLGHFVPALLDQDSAETMLMEAVKANDWHSDSWNVAHGKSWTAATVIGSALANGMAEPWEISEPVAGETVGTDLPIISAAASAYWLQNALGSNGLSGFFLRGGQVVHTPLVNQDGYVSPKHEGDGNGPAQIQAVNAAQLAAKIQYAYRCYKTIKDKETKEESEVPALFPLQAAQRAVDAPEAMGQLRRLDGLTLTPMVRADGSILATPGYDPASRYLFLPGPGVAVPTIPDRPSDADVDKAVALLDRMLVGFPWETKDDRANYLGLLLTPLLRLVTPPSYKLFGIGAHQPGSGKTLLADVATILHGGVLRSEVPEDEAEWRKQVTSILSTTTAPIVHIDNITGVLKSSVLAGLLTAGQPVTDRELGSSRMITTVNDRTWVVTGNNLSLGGDLVRRTIIITIDPNMANPERREFAITDLKGWVAEHRNELLWSLLVMIRRWVVEGMPQAARPQSDSFARWEASVAGILSVCRIEGEFDRESGKRAAAGGDDDGLAKLLEWIITQYPPGHEWTVGQLLVPPPGQFVSESRDWLPLPVLDKLARSEAAGRISFGRWLQNRLGRWVTTDDGVSLVLRNKGKDRNKQVKWTIEQHG